MPLGEIAGEIVVGLLRFVAQFFFDVVLEVLVRGPGYFIGRIFSRYIDPDGLAVLFIGVMFWVAIGGCGYGLYRFLSA
jgi:hypothetical protein